jgi:hypothetical protein
MNGEADCPTDLEMAAPKGQGRVPPGPALCNLSSLSHMAICRAHPTFKGSLQYTFSELEAGCPEYYKNKASLNLGFS